MSVTFDVAELEVIRGLRDSAEAQERPFADAYQFISRRLRGDAIGAGEYGGVVGQVSPAELAVRSPAPDLDPTVNQVELWFAGAARANVNQGPFSRLIREYTVRQGLFRYNESFSDVLVQQASDEVARKRGQVLKYQFSL